MHTGALYLTPQDQQPVADCKRLHTYGIAIFLATFLFTLLGITVSPSNKCETGSDVTLSADPPSPAPGPRGQSPPYLQADGNVMWLPRKPAAGLLPGDGPADAAVPSGLPPLLGAR